MTTAIILNIVLASFVVIGIVGWLAWSIVSSEHDTVTGEAPAAPRRRSPASPRPRVVGQVAQHRA